MPGKYYSSRYDGWTCSLFLRYMPILRAGFTVWTLGAGLKLLFNRNTHIALYVVVLAVEGAGIGWVHQPGE